jgi:iron complex transport system ATP-binding protein
VVGVTQRGVRCVDVGVRYGDRRAVVGVDLTIAPGDWVTVIGPNGAGKSSLLGALAGLVPSSGTITVDGITLADLSPRERARHVSLVPQEPALPPDMTVSEYVLLGRWPYAGRFGAESSADRAICAEALARLELDGFEGRPLGELSGGERQRVVLARTLAQRTPVVLLDEPTSALDLGHQQQALELVAELRDDLGLTVLSAMHDLTLAGLYADRLVMLDAGRVVADGTARSVLTAARIETVYRVAVTVDVGDDGGIVVVPRRTSTVTARTASDRVERAGVT